MKFSVARRSDSPRLARQTIVRALHAHHWQESHVATAALLVSEVVTNAVIHGSGDITVSYDLTDDGLRVGVSDHSPTRPQVQHPDLDAPSGRGMQLVERLATRWGVEIIPRGKTVWFEVAG